MNGTWSAAINTCSATPCGALQNDEHANWPTAPGLNKLVTGVCVAGYASSAGGVGPQRMCTSLGQWDSAISDPCVQIACSTSEPGFLSYNAEWPSTVAAGSGANGVCVAGYRGTTYRSCTMEGVWTMPSPLCQAVMCAAIASDGVSSWPATQAGSSATGMCAAGYTGAPTRQCTLDGVWDAVGGSPCVPKTCPALSEGDASWNVTSAGMTTMGTCNEGFSGVVLRVCSTDAIWQPISGSCARMECAAETANNIAWVATLAGSVAVGQCTMGYGSVDDVVPTRTCNSDGVWSAVTGACERLQCPAGTYLNARWPVSDSFTPNVLGVCVEGFSGMPMRNCSAEGVYAAHVANPCVALSCNAVDEGKLGAWDDVVAGASEVVGRCPAGTEGEPTRNCNINGTWEEIVNPCTSTLECCSWIFVELLCIYWHCESNFSRVSGVYSTFLSLIAVVPLVILY